MNVPAGSEWRTDTRPKKKYELSLKKIKNNIQTERNYLLKRDTSTEDYNGVEESDGSQNFKLQVSNSFTVDDTYDETRENGTKVTKKPETEVILISDSSDDETPEKFAWMNIKSSDSSRRGIRKSTSAPHSIYIVESSDSENDDPRHRQGSKAGSLDVPVTERLKKCSIAYTSDEDISEDQSTIDKNNVIFDGQNNVDISYVTPKVAKNFQDSEKKLISISERFRELLNDDNNVELESDLKGNKRENVFYSGNDNESRITPTATKNDRHTEKKLISNSDRVRQLCNDDYSLKLKSKIKSNKIDNALPRKNNKENELRTTPTITRDGQDNDKKKLISSSERFRGILNDGRKLETKSDKNSDKKENLFNWNIASEIQSNVTPTATRNGQDIENKLISSSDRVRSILTDNACNINKRGSTKCLTEISRKAEDSKRTPVATGILSRTPKLTDSNKKSEETRRTPISTKISSRTTVLTKKDAQQILRAIKSKKVVYESPKVWKKWDDSNDRKKNIRPRNGIVIAETDSDSDGSVVEGSKVDTSKPYKSHVSRFLEPVNSDNGYTDLSETKKLEVTKWLLTNTVDTRSDSSVSNISGSKGGSPRSGNSSLERLEQNYETPNNRGKLKKIESTEKPITAPSSTRSVKSVRQTTIDEFLTKSKDGKHNIFTPINTAVSKKQNLINPAIQETTDALDIMDCAHILDNLYGNAWRARAQDLLPSSEPRKTNIARKDKGVQTERKVVPRIKNIPKKSSGSSSQDDDFNTFVRNIKPNLNSTKKPATITSRGGCSFIHDSTSSAESGGESTYLTALTNPRISDIRKVTKKQTPMSLAIQRAQAICDPDTDDEENKGYDYRKQLSFSDDETSSTSEYDPNDVIKPKTTAKTLKTPKDVYKTSKLAVPKPTIKTPTTKSFLASLCAIIPLKEAHPDAKKYRQSYKTTKDELCKHLYKLYNDKVFDNKLPQDMLVEWNVRMRGTAGYCYNKRSVRALGGITRSSRIVLATKILDTPDRLRDTLLHEMCHAAAWLVNEVTDGHGPFWKAWASKAMKAFPDLPPIRRCHDYEIKTKFTYRCTGCGYSVGRHSKSLDINKKCCGHCFSKFELLINKVTKSGTVEMQTPKQKQTTGFALFVKENYHSVKKDRKGVAHKEVMQILGQQFSAIKITKKANNIDDNDIEAVTKT